MTLTYLKEKEGQYSPNNKKSTRIMDLNEYVPPTHLHQKLSNEQRPVIRPEKGLVQKLKSFKK